MIKKVLLSGMILMSSMINASPLDNILTGGISGQPLPVEEAFPVEIEKSENGFSLIVDIKEGHYLYKEKFGLSINGESVDLELPKAKEKYDEYFGNVEVYHYGFGTKIDYSKNVETYDVVFNYQGCAEEINLCYPKAVYKNSYKNENYKKQIEDPVFGMLDVIEKKQAKKEVEKTEQKEISISDVVSTNNVEDVVDYIKSNKDSPMLWGSFILIGILVAFTPCIYPMMPIIIASTSSSKTPTKASAFYVVGIILAYAFIGLVTGFFQINLQMALQGGITQYVISGVLLIASFYLFGVFNKILPDTISMGLTNKINSIATDKDYNQILIGFLSSLLLSPCAIAPLLGVLAFINQVGEPLYGSLLLGLMGLGIGIPLFVLSTSLKKFMPKNGMWMNVVKEIMAYALIALAVYFSFSGLIANILFSLIAFSFGMSLFGLTLTQRIGLLFMLVSSLFALNSLISSNSIESENKKSEIKLETVGVSSFEEYNALISSTNKPVFVDFYADWCITCVRLENSVLNKEKLIKYLNNNFLVLKIDLTDISNEEQELMDQLSIIGVPYYMFMDKDKNASVYTGDLSYNDFFNILKMNNEAKDDQ